MASKVTACLQNILLKISFIDYTTTERIIGREIYICCCNRNERMGLAWYRSEIWKLKGPRGDNRKVQD
jgi:hypothetical protein